MIMRVHGNTSFPKVLDEALDDQTPVRRGCYCRVPTENVATYSRTEFTASTWKHLYVFPLLIHKSQNLNFSTFIFNWFYIFSEKAPRKCYQESVLKFVASRQIPAGGYWGPGRTSCSWRTWEPSTWTQQAGQAPHCPGSFPQNLSKEILAGPENAARFN